MIVYSETKTKFLDDVRSDEIDDIIENRVYTKLHHRTSDSEKRSWANSLSYMYRVMEDRRIPKDSQVAIEYRVPNSNKRIDFMICGEDKKHVESVVLVELKQWEEAKKIDSSDGLIETWLHGGMRQTTHPSYQAWSYTSMIEDYNADVRKHHIELKPCACLHNYKIKQNDDLLASCYKYYIDKAPVFAKGDSKKLSDFIVKYIHKGNPDVLYHIEKGKIIPSKSLQDSMVSLLRGRKEFTLIDDQKVIYERALQISKTPSERKQVYIIHGGPGTGKSVLAINLLVAILNQAKNVMYVTKNSAPRNVYMKKLRNGKYRKTYIDNLFKSSGSFMNSENNEFDCLLVDEAHRLNEKSGLYHNLGENQIKEIIHAAQFSVFFVDDHQIVTATDIGSTDEIKRWCREFNAEVYEDTLLSQFRCNGSDSYLSWIDRVLDINPEATDEFDYDFDIRICDTPQEVRELIEEKNKENNKARIVAGYCWNWIKDGKNSSDVYDIKIGDFKMSWNLGNSSTWAIDPDSVKEAGCIHTCQGLEFDYVGVIIGDDLRYENGQIVTDLYQRARTDQSIKGLKEWMKNDPEGARQKADQIIKNTYRTLMTRGQKGCYIYCTDPGLQAYLKKMLPEAKKK
jgi:DUF2075 family protein/chromosomal replication initiation ATPase DnaA